AIRSHRLQSITTWATPSSCSIYATTPHHAITIMPHGARTGKRSRRVAYLDPSRRELLRHLIGAAQSDPELAREFWEKWIGPRREEGRNALKMAGMSPQEEAVMIDLLFGAFYYRLLMPYAEIDDAYIDLVVRMVIPETA
ncbi:MAG: TetR-like C-terminal domain-containing protein, partial [Burkholderia sp.]